MSNLRALRTTDINPAIVLQALQKDIETLQDIYVVAIDKEGHPIVFASGNLQGLSHASLVLHDLALKQLNGLIEPTE